MFKNLKSSAEIRFTSAQTREMSYKKGSSKRFALVLKCEKTKIFNFRLNFPCVFFKNQLN